MKNSIAYLFVLTALGLPAAGQACTNLDFESAVVQLNDPMCGFLDWSLAAPGWGHSSGLATEAIYYGHEHIGLNQYYMLYDSNSPAYAPNTQIAGAYSLALASGTSNMPPDTTWVLAYISQTGAVPASARSLRLLARSGNAYAGDIALFAGAVAELKIMNVSTSVHEPTVVDNITFSSEPAPGQAALEIGLYARLLINGGFPDHHILAIRPDGSGNVTQTHIAWRTTRGVAYVPSPIIAGDYFLTITDAGVAHCFAAKTGDLLWTQRLGAQHASLVSAGGHVYFLNDKGVTTVVQPGPQFRRVAENSIGEKCFASPAISRRQLFLRGERRLFCIERDT